MAKRNTKWEMQSIENFVEQLMDEERQSYSREELFELAESLKLQTLQVVYALECYGIKPAPYKAERKVRTYSDNPHNLWSHPDMRCGGGSGGEAIMGFYDGRGCSRSVR